MSLRRFSLQNARTLATTSDCFGDTVGERKPYEEDLTYMPDSEELDEFDRLFKLEPSREDSGVSAELSAMSDFRYDNQSTYDFFPPQESFMTPAQDVLTCPEVFENAEGASFGENQEAAQQSAPLESSSLEASTEEHSRITLKKSI